MSDLSEPSSPESEMYDTTADLLGSVQDDVANQLAAAGPVGVAAAAAVMSCRKRKHPHHFETNPSRRKRQQTRLLRKLRNTIEEYSSRVGQQAVVLCCTPSVSQSMQMYKVFGSQPLENVMRNNKQHILQELEQALQEQTPPSNQENSHLHELPPLVIDGIPTQVDKMTQAQLRNFIPEMLKYSTGRSKPGWGRMDSRPVWWPSDLPWANVRSDVRTEDDKKRVPWTDALRQIVKNCYMHHGRGDLLQVFKEEGAVQVHQQQTYTGTMMQTINNPDGTVSIITIDPGPNSVVTLPDGTQATVVHAVHDHLQDGQLQPGQHYEMVTTDINQSVNATSSVQEIAMVTQHQQQALNALQASLSSSGHIILTGADASQLGGIMTVLPVSMYQSVQGVPAVHTVQTIQSLPNMNFQVPQNQQVQIAMAPMVNTAECIVTSSAGAMQASMVKEESVTVELAQQQQQLQQQQQQQQQNLHNQSTDVGIETCVANVQVLNS